MGFRPTSGLTVAILNFLSLYWVFYWRYLTISGNLNLLKFQIYIDFCGLSGLFSSHFHFCVHHLDFQRNGASDEDGTNTVVELFNPKTWAETLKSCPYHVGYQGGGGCHWCKRNLVRRTRVNKVMSLLLMLVKLAIRNVLRRPLEPDNLLLSYCNS